MATNLTISLSDAEQARLTAVARQVRPAATAAQVNTWAEKVCKEALRVKVRELAVHAQREIDNTNRRTLEAAWSADWPEPVAP
jgi:hypothetical protein